MAEKCEHEYGRIIRLDGTAGMRLIDIRCSLCRRPMPPVEFRLEIGSGTGTITFVLIRGEQEKRAAQVYIEYGDFGGVR